jgi:alpha-tubulin suppressor-like RCC1 family protein
LGTKHVFFKKNIFISNFFRNGQLGNGIVGGTYNIPTEVLLNYPIIDIECGAKHACAVINDTSTAYCWGLNEFKFFF